MKPSSSIKVFHAPDYRRANNYQHLLSEKLAQQSVTSAFDTNYYRIAPLSRTLSISKPDILHLHWPEEYFLTEGKIHCLLRQLRYSIDLLVCSSRSKIVWTAHNLMPHNRRWVNLSKINLKFTAAISKAVICHSPHIETNFNNAFPGNSRKTHIISHGNNARFNHSELDKDQLRATLGIPLERKVFLTLGRIAPYKNLEAILSAADKDFTDKGGYLIVAGECDDPAYLNQLKKINPVHWETRFLEDDELEKWIHASDACVFAHKIPSSGTALLSRIKNRPIVVPVNFPGIPVAHPGNDPCIILHDFNKSLGLVLDHVPNKISRIARNFHERLLDTTNWDTIAEQHHHLYRSCVGAQ